MQTQAKNKTGNKFKVALQGFFETIHSSGEDFSLEFSIQKPKDRSFLILRKDERIFGYVLINGSIPDRNIVKSIQAGLDKLVEKFDIEYYYERPKSILSFDDTIEDSPIPHCLLDENDFIIKANRVFRNAFQLIDKNEPFEFKNLFYFEASYNNFSNSMRKFPNHRIKEAMKINEATSFFGEISSVQYSGYSFPTFLISIYDMTNLKKSQEELNEKESQFRSLVEQSITGIFIIQDEIIRYANPYFCDMFGYSENEISGINFLELIHPDNRDVIAHRLRSGEDVKFDRNFSYKFHGISRSGKKIYLQVNASFSIYEGKNAIIGTVSDITKPTERTKKLKESEQKFRILTDKAPTAILIYKGESIIYANPATEKITGFSHDELMNMKFWELVHPEIREQIRENGLKRQKGENVPSRYSFKILTKDGKIKWIDFSGNVIKLNGQPAGIIVASDITESVKSKRRLKIINRFLESVNNSVRVDFRRENIKKGVKKIIDIFNSNPNVSACWYLITKADSKIQNCIASESDIEHFYHNLIQNNEIAQCVHQCKISNQDADIANVNELSCNECIVKDRYPNCTRFISLVRDHYQRTIGAFYVIMNDITEEKDDLEAIWKDFSSHFSEKIANFQLLQDLQTTNKHYIESKQRLVDFLLKTKEGICQIRFKNEINLDETNRVIVDKTLSTGIIEEANPAFAEQFKRTHKSEFIGYTLDQAFKNQNKIRELIEQFVQNGFKLQDALYNQEINGKNHLFNVSIIDTIRDGKLDSIWIMQNEITDIHTINNIISKIMSEFVSLHPIEFIKNIIAYTRESLQEDYILVAEYFKGKNILKPLAFFDETGEIKANDFKIENTPFLAAIEQPTYLGSDLKDKYSKAHIISEYRINEILTVTLKNSENQIYGIIAIMSKSNLYNSNLANTVLNLISTRISSELQRMEYENALKRSRNDMKIILDSALKAFVYIGNDYIVKAFNKPAVSLFANFFGINLKKGMNYADLYFERDFASFKRNFYSTINSGRKMDMEFERRDKLNKLQNIAISYEPAKDESGNYSGVICSYEIVTQQVRTQAKLVEESRFNTILMENTFDAIHVFDFEGNIIKVNKAFSEIIGYEIDDIIGKNLKKFCPAFKGIENENQITPDGQYFNATYISDRGVPITLELTEQIVTLGEEKYILRSGRDITEKLLRLNEIKKLSVGIEQSPASIIITDIEGNIEYVNNKFTEVTGWHKDLVIGKHVRILKSGTMNKQVYKNLWETILDGRTWTGEFCNKKRNGELFWELASISPIFNTNGEIVNFIAVKEDITESRKIRIELENSERKLNELLKSQAEQLRLAEDNFKWIADKSKDMIIQLGPYSTVLYINSNSNNLFDFKITDYISKNWNDIPFSEETRNELNKLLDESRNSLTSVRGRIKTRKNLYLDITVETERKENSNTIISQILYGHEVTEHIKEKEIATMKFEREKELNKIRAEIFSMASHDFKTPFQVILSASEFIEMYNTKVPQEDLVSSAKDIQSAINECTDMLEDVKIAYSNEENFNPSTKKEIDIAKEIEEIINSLTILDKQNHIIEFNNDCSVKNITANKVMFRRAITNLLNNAIKYSQPNSTIKCDLSDNSQWVRIVISDSGIGIKEEDIPNLFDAYYRASNVGATKGSGLGLAVVKKFCSTHGADIIVDSKLNEGTTFTLLFPKENSDKND